MSSSKQFSRPLYGSIIKWILQNLGDICMHDRLSSFCSKFMPSKHFFCYIWHPPPLISESKNVLNDFCLISWLCFSCHDIIPTWRFCNDSSLFYFGTHSPEGVFFQIKDVLRTHSEVHPEDEHIISCPKETIARNNLLDYSLL